MQQKGVDGTDEKVVYEICKTVDEAIAKALTESIVKGTSYDMLEAHYGCIPISRNCFYRKRRIVKMLINEELEKNTKN